MNVETSGLPLDSPQSLRQPAETPSANEYQIVIKAGQTESLYWRDLFRFREVLFLLAYRNVSVQYKQTLMGIAWALVRPIMTMLVFVFIFGRVAQLPSEGGVPYPLLVLAGMLPWQLFASVLSEASNSLVANSNLVSKIYFPRLIVPLSSLGTGLVDFLVSLPVLIIMMLVYSVHPTWRILLLPLFVALTILACYSLGLWLCALNVRYRDVRYVIPFIVQFGLFISPVGYSTTNVPTEWCNIYSCNPMVGVIDGLRWCLFGPAVDPPFQKLSFYVSLALVFLMLTGGIRYFRRTERTFADVI